MARLLTGYLQEYHIHAHHPEFWGLGQSMRDNFVGGGKGGGGGPIRAYISNPEPLIMILSFTN